MMTNLFSIFDPSSSILSTAWLAIPLALFMHPMKMWMSNSNLMKMKTMMMNNFSKEVKFTLNKTEKSVESMLMLPFILIITMNFVALYPQIFSPTSHLSITLPLSMTFWLSVILFGWMKNTNHMLAHLVPLGTPNALMMFMVLIELVSNMIRPITLCVRLTANLIAGHLLMTLLGNAMMNLSLAILPMSIVLPMILTILESAVACIQAYVFMTLITLYTTELK